VARFMYDTVASDADGVPAGKTLCKAGDAIERGPTGGLVTVRVAVIGLDAPGMKGTNVREEARAWFAGPEYAELAHRAALRGSTIVLGIRDRYDPARAEHAALRRLHRQTFGDF
jgi:hypothetical protein